MARLVAVAVLLFALVATAGGAAARSVPMRIAIGASHTSGDSTAYRLHVEAPGAAQTAIVPDDARRASLEVNGIVVQTVGRELPVGLAPLGHGMAVLLLENLRPSDRITIRLTGTADAPILVNNVDALARAHSVGFGGGAYYAILATVAVFQIAAFFALRDATIAWYIGFICALLGVECASDELLPFGYDANVFGVLGFGLLASCCVVGFSSSYLRLRKEAPRLFVAAIFWNAAPLLISVIIHIFTHREIDDVSIILPDFVGLLALLIITALRRRSGYLPATFLGFGLLGITTVFSAQIYRHVVGISSPFADRWSFELGALFDVLVFSIGISVRGQFMLQERKRIEEDLREATYAARHDGLTSLLNRRGLDARMTELGDAEATVLFIDIDGFKLVNDGGGHAAGDDTLKIVSRIMQHAVRKGDVVARIGGDEFVVVLTGHTESPDLDDITSRISSAVAFLHPLGADNPTRIGVSIGTATLAHGTPFARALAEADADAYRVKAEHHTKAREVRRRLATQLQA